MSMVRTEIVGLTELQRDLKRLAPEVLKALRKRWRTAAGPIAAEAKASAGSWSTRIPRAISISTSNKGIAIVLSRTKAPHGSIYELGSGGHRGVVRHPLFGDREHWFETPTRPFLFPAVERHRDDVFRAAEEAVDDAAREAGLA